MGLQPGLGQVGQAGEHPAVDLARADVVAAALVDLDALVGEHAPLQQRLGQQQDLADREAVGLLVAVEHVAVRRPGRSRWPRAASSRRGSAWGRFAGLRGRPDGSRSPGGRPCRPRAAPTRPEHRAADHPRPDLQPAQAEALGIERPRPPCRSTARSRAGCRSARAAPARRPRGRAGATGWRTAAASPAGRPAARARRRSGRAGGRQTRAATATGRRGGPPRAAWDRCRPWAPGSAAPPRPGRSTCSGCRTRPGAPRTPAARCSPIRRTSASFIATTGAPRWAKSSTRRPVPFA